MKTNSKLHRIETHRLKAVFGKAATVPNGATLTYLVDNVSYAEAQSKDIPNRREVRNQKIAPLLAELLGDAITELNPKPFEDLSKVIRAVKKQRAQGSERTFQCKAVELADRIRSENRLGHDEALPITQHNFIELVEPERVKRHRRNGKADRKILHDALRWERSQLAQLGIRFTLKA